MFGSRPTFVSADTVRDGLAAGAALLDVRTPDEVAAGTLDGALVADVLAPDFDARARALDTSPTYYVFCRSGARSETAAARLRAIGLDAHNAGGIDALVLAGLPVGG